MRRLSLILAAVLLAAVPACAQEVRIARLFCMCYVLLNVMEHEKLMEIHATALGLKDVLF